MFELFAGFFLIWLLIAVACLAVWIWALVDAIRNPALDDTRRLIWVLVIVFTSVLGAIIYLAVAKSPGPVTRM